MSAKDKIKNAAEEAKGRTKRTAGAATGNRSQEAEGQLEEKKGQTKQAGEKLKDAIKS